MSSSVYPFSQFAIFPIWPAGTIMRLALEQKTSSFGDYADTKKVFRTANNMFEELGVGMVAVICPSRLPFHKPIEFY
jgi:hypothetical protein